MKLITLENFLSCVPDNEFVCLELHEKDPRLDEFRRVFYQSFYLRQHPAYMYLKDKLVRSVCVDESERHLVIRLSLVALHQPMIKGAY